MQKTAYTCDECSKEFGEKKHLTFSFGSHSGVANPPTKTGKSDGRDYWQTEPTINGKFMHFCNGQCIGRYFTKLMAK